MKAFWTKSPDREAIQQSIEMVTDLYVRFPEVLPSGRALSEGQPALGSNLHMLDRALTKAGLVSLSHFVWEEVSSAPQSDADLPAQAETWFPADEGLSAVGAAIKHFHEKPRALPWSDIALRELQAIQKVLQVARKHDLPFHFVLSR